YTDLFAIGDSMRFMSIFFVFFVACLSTACTGPYAAVSRQEPLEPLPEVSQTTIAPMKAAFLQMPVECRKAVQEGLTKYGMYGGVADGLWNTSVGHGLVAYVSATGNTAHGWPSVQGSKGILWNVSQGDARCPNATLSM
ncbi:MAG: hypothetical protein WBA92_04295, partial [Pseudorhodobacter sp.]